LQRRSHIVAPRIGLRPEKCVVGGRLTVPEAAGVHRRPCPITSAYGLTRRQCRISAASASCAYDAFFELTPLAGRIALRADMAPSLAPAWCGHFYG
jgi:hypothetical protein